MGNSRRIRSITLSQSTVSMQMKKLADMIGAPLIEQVGKKIRLTADGQELARATREIFSILDHYTMSVDEKITLERLAREPWLMREKGSGTRNAIERRFAERAITLHPRLELGSNEATKQAILAGLGISALSRHALKGGRYSGMHQAPCVAMCCCTSVERQLLLPLADDRERLPTPKVSRGLAPIQYSGETTVKFTPKIAALGLALAFAIPSSLVAHAEEFAPYGTAKVDMHAMPVTDVVFDVNYEDPQQLNILYNFVRNTQKITKGKVVVVTHGPELRAFAKENYSKYQGAIDKMAELAKDGVEFKMCNNAMKAAGFSAEDMHGFITVVPAGFPELAYWQGKGYEYINPIPLSVKDVRYLDQPQLKK